MGLIATWPALCKLFWSWQPCCLVKISPPPLCSRTRRKLPRRLARCGAALSWLVAVGKHQRTPRTPRLWRGKRRLCHPTRLCISLLPSLSSTPQVSACLGVCVCGTQSCMYHTPQNRPRLLKYAGIGSRLLRQMGWAEGQGLGANRQGRAQPVLPTQRPKGLGLGADA
jgi:hypothetical protein